MKTMIKKFTGRMQNDNEDIFQFGGFRIPVSLVNLTGGGPDSFQFISDLHINHLQETVGLQSNHSIVEIGCGIGRDAIPLTKILGKNGKYLGIDIIEPSISWCSSNISRKFPHFSFVHFDVKDQLHNPNGKSNMTEFRIPADDHSVDRIILWSVFTHLFEKDIEHYLREFRRILAPQGTVLVSFFLVNEAVLASTQRPDRNPPSHLSFLHKLGAGCFINSLEFPAGAVAYTDEALRSMVEKSGLVVVDPIRRGGWSGHYPDTNNVGQDTVVISQ